MTQAEQQIVPHARRKEIGDRADVTDPPAGNRQRYAVEVGIADDKPSAGRGDEAGKELRDEISAAVALADDRYIGAERKIETDGLQQMDAVAVHHSEIGGGDLAVQRLDLLRLFEQQAFVEHIRDLELLDDLLILDRHILLVLIKVEQLLPRRRQLLISGEHRDQRAPRELALDHKVTADQKEQEWR